MNEDAIEYGLGLRAVPSEGRWRLEAADFALVQDKLGAPILSNLARAMEGANRIVSLHQMLVLNEQCGRETIAFERNLFTLACMLWGTIQETSDALMKMRKAGARSKVTNVGDWDDLDGIAKRWDGNADFVAMRNNLAFHLGSPEIALRGIASLVDEKEPVELLLGDGRRMFDGRVTFAINALFAGCDISKETFATFVDAAIEDHSSLPDRLFLLLHDLLRTAGATLEAPTFAEYIASQAEPDAEVA